MTWSNYRFRRNIIEKIDEWYQNFKLIFPHYKEEFYEFIENYYEIYEYRAPDVAQTPKERNRTVIAQVWMYLDDYQHVHFRQCPGINEFIKSVGGSYNLFLVIILIFFGTWINNEKQVSIMKQYDMLE